MDYKELNQALADLDQLMYSLEETYIENEGECTDETDAMEDKIEVLKDLLKGDGVDMLGAWLKSKQDKKARLKAEKDYITRQMNAIDESIDFIAAKICHVMDATGITKTEKGVRGYAFEKTKSVTTKVDKEVLEAIYEDKINEALTAARIPCYVNVKLDASVTKFDEFGPLNEGDEQIFHKVERDTIKITKPRASKK